jgi:hypothetical protein
MVHPQVADGREGLWIWRVAVNVLNKQLGWLVGPPAWELAAEQITLHKEIVTKQLGVAVML